MKQHCSNAEKVVSFLETQKKENVIYPTNHQGEIKERAKKYMQGGYGSLVGMDVGTREAGSKFIDNLKMLYHVANIGDARSLAIHPATTTHSQLNDKELLAAGVTPGYVRLSIGIEHPDDIIADIKTSFSSLINLWPQFLNWGHVSPLGFLLDWKAIASFLADFFVL